jgi:hypothetical protein
MASNRFLDRNDPITREFLCFLKNNTQSEKGRENGLTPEEVYNHIQGFPGSEGEAKTQIIDQLVTACAQNGYIERIMDRLWFPTWWEPSQNWWRLVSSGRIRMTTCGIKLCDSPREEDGKSYCASGQKLSTL